jgi:hypothetical protein
MGLCFSVGSSGERTTRVLRRNPRRRPSLTARLRSLSYRRCEGFASVAPAKIGSFSGRATRGLRTAPLLLLAFRGSTDCLHLQGASVQTSGHSCLGRHKSQEFVLIPLQFVNLILGDQHDVVPLADGV